MAITVTLNFNERTINQVDLNEIITLTATATDSNDPGRDPDNFVYSWSIIDLAPDSNFALSANVGRTVTGIMDAWGTNRVFCIATNPDTGANSEDDPLLAPSTAFCDIKVKHSRTNLQKPARSQRNWHEEYWDLVDWVANHTIEDADDVPNAYGQSDLNPDTRVSGILQLGSATDVAKGDDYDVSEYTAAQAASGVAPHYAVLPSALIDAINDAQGLGVTGVDANGSNDLARAVEDRAIEALPRTRISAHRDVTYTRDPLEGDRWRWDAAEEEWIPYHPHRFDEGIILNSAGEDFSATDNAGDVGAIAWTKNDQTYARIHYDITDNYLEVENVASFAPVSDKNIDLGTDTQRWGTLYLAADSIDMENGVISMGANGVMNITENSVTKEVPSISGTKVTNGFVKWDGTNFVTETLTAAEGDITDVIAGTGLSGGGSAGSVTLNVAGLTLSEFASGEIALGGETFVDTDDQLMSAAAINDLIESKGYTTNTGDIEGVTAGTGLSGGGTSGTVTLNVSGLTTTEFASSAILQSGETFADVDTQIMTSAAIADYVAANAGSGSSSVGDNRDIQLSDGSGAFVASNWQVSTGDDLIPVTTNAYDVGSSTNRVRKVYAYDGQFYDDVRVEGDLTVVGQQIMQDYAYINDDGAAGSLLFTAGQNGAVTGSIRNLTDDVIIESVASGSEAKMTFKAQGSAYTQSILSNSSKISNNNTIKLPSMQNAPSVGDFARTTVVSGRDVEVEFESVVERIVYSTHVSREVTEEGSFDGSGNLVFTGNQQACMYWVKNNTGSTIDLKSTHIHVGEMKNITLSFSLVKATSDANAISNTWTQVGSTFTLTNSSGTDNVVGQAQSSVYTTTSIAAGQYIGLVCTDIPVLNRDDRRIVISFECEKTL